MLGTPRLPLILVAAGDPSAAAGTNIAISAAAAGGGYRHASEGRVDWAVVRWMTPPSLAGAVAVLAAGLAGALPGPWAGSRIAGRASELVLRRAIGVALLAVAAAFLVEAAVR